MAVDPVVSYRCKRDEHLFALLFSMLSSFWRSAISCIYTCSRSLFASEWFARFIGFSWSSCKRACFLRCCHCHLLLMMALRFWCPYIRNSLLSQRWVGFILYAMHVCVYESMKWSQTIAWRWRYSCTRISFTLHRPYSQIIIICQ